MPLAALLLAALAAADVADYARPLDAKSLDQATLDTEGFGEKKAFKREDAGLRVTLEPGAAETGWKSPQGLTLGGDFTITAEVVVHKLPKPAQEDGTAVGLAIATQNTDQPDATLVRLTETTGDAVYRAINSAKNAPQQPQMMMVQQFGGPVGKAVKPPRPTFPAGGDAIKMELKREGQVVRYQVVDAVSKEPRYLGQLTLGNNDVSGFKLFATNRNGAEAVDVTLRSLTVQAERINGLGTEVRSVFGEVVRGDPTAIEDGKLIVGGPVKNPPEEKPATPANASPAANPPAPTTTAAPAAAPAAVAVAVAPAPAAPAAPAPPVVAFNVQLPAQAAPAADKPAAKAEAKAETKSETKPEKPPEPKAKIPFGEVEGITFQRSFTMSGKYVGQVNLDDTMPGAADEKSGGAKAVPKTDDVTAPPPGTVAPTKIAKLEPKPNGIRDLQISLANLRSSPIKQVTVTGQTDKGAANWRLDTTDSRDWPLVLRRGGVETWADLFLEPPDGDLKDKDLTVTVTFEDGQNANATVKVTEKTDPKLAYDPKSPGLALDARVYLTGDEQLFGKIQALGEDTLKLKTPWGDTLDVPLARVVGIYNGIADHKETPESFARRLRSRPTEDLLLARSKDEVVPISGVAEGVEGEKLLFRFQEKSRSLPLKQVEGLVLATRPEPERPEGIRPSFAMAGGLVVSGLWKSLDAKTWVVETDWGQPLNLPAAEVRSVRFRGGEMTYLSDLTPAKVEETSYFGRKPRWRKDVNLAGEPLKMGGRTYEHGLAVHSRTSLAYDLDGQYATFEATVGFDDAAGSKGRVDCRILADGKEVYANPDLRADAPPTKISVPIRGAGRVTLVVDFGHDQDTGDRVIWANARLYRKPPPAPQVASPAPKTDADSPKKPGSGG